MKPRIFIGSSVEGLKVANALQQNLDPHDAHCTVWTQGVFGLGNTNIDALLDVTRANDLSIFVFSSDDVVTYRKQSLSAVRDNVLFESGLFMGKHGRRRTFIVTPTGGDLHIPTDLLGLIPAGYDADRAKTDPIAALGTAANAVRMAITKLKWPVDSLVFSVKAETGKTFPVKLEFTIRNTGVSPLALTSDYFEFTGSIRPHPNAKGDPIQNRFETKFPDAKGSFCLFQTILAPGQSVTTWVPLDPAHTLADIQAAISNSASKSVVGKWHFTCHVLNDEPQYQVAHHQF